MKNPSNVGSAGICCALLILIVTTALSADDVLRYSPDEPKIQEALQSAKPVPKGGHHLSVGSNIVGEWKAVRFPLAHYGAHAFRENPNVHWKVLQFKPNSTVEITYDSPIDGLSETFVGRYDIIPKAILSPGGYSWGTFPNIAISAEGELNKNVAILIHVRIAASNMGPSIYPMLQFEDPEGYHYFFEPVSASEDRLIELTGQTAWFLTSIRGAEFLQGALGVEATCQSVGRWGVGFTLQRGGQPLGAATIGLFGSNAEARQVFDECVRLTSETAPRSLRSDLGNRTVAWDGRVLLVRNNALIDLRLSTTSAENVVDLIDSALRNPAVDVISTSSTIQVPAVVDVALIDGQWSAQTNPQVSGDSALVDKDGQPAQTDAEASLAVFATYGCVMARPLAVTPQLLAVRRGSPLNSADLARVAAEEAQAKAEEEAQEHQRQFNEALTILLDEEASPHVRNKAVLAFGNLKDPAAVPYLLDILTHDPNYILKQNAIRALGQIGDSRVGPVLIAFLEKPVTGNVTDEAEWEAILRRNTVNALGQIGDPAALPVLRDILDATPEYQSVREFARIAIREIEGE